MEILWGGREEEGGWWRWVGVGAEGNKGPQTSEHRSGTAQPQCEKLVWLAQPGRAAFPLDTNKLTEHQQLRKGQYEIKLSQIRPLDSFV